MRQLWLSFAIATLAALPVSAKTVVFSEAGFPTVDSQPIPASTLSASLGSDITFADLNGLRRENALQGVDLLVLPYGSAVPVAAWSSIEAYVHTGGNLLILGGQPLHVPVSGEAGNFKQERPQDTFSRVLDFRHTYQVPVSGEPNFAWRTGYTFLPHLAVRALRFFAVEGKLDGLGYVVDADGSKLAAPVIVADHSIGGLAGGSMSGSRVVAIDMDPQPGYWQSADGVTLIRAAAEYAQAGSTEFWIEAQYSTLRPGEIAQLTLHLHKSHDYEAARPHSPSGDQAHVEIWSGEQRIAEYTVTLPGSRTDAPIPFRQPVTPGLYRVTATYVAGGKAREFYRNGFFVEDSTALESGPAFGANKDFLTLGGKPFFPVGTNYFSTESNGWDFSGPRNALVWDEDFADMERHGVSFVRTGVWMSNAKFVEPLTGEADERFLRNLEAYLAAAHRHHIVVNFTFFAFVPRMGEQYRRPNPSGAEPPPPNPYLDPAVLRAERTYVVSIVDRFKRVPWLSYDLINEPSFSNPRRVFHGNVPNGDPTEVAAWHRWLQQKYDHPEALAEAWSVPPTQLVSFESVPLPDESDLTYDRYGNQHEVRALDYNLFAQDMFSGWVRDMANTIHHAGSSQLINVGQDEGGVTNRVLNQFYATSGVAFTTNHTYWQDDALLWDSIAAKRPGMPNITGETGYQPVWEPDGTWRYDEFTGQALEERKWVLGFAAGSSGAVQWDWDREVDFGIERSDGSAKVWEKMMQELGRFAHEAAPYATAWNAPQVAIILPQSLQLSAYNAEALSAQQTAVRVLHNYNHVAAYAVGEYQPDTLGDPKLILLPSAYALTDAAWKAIEDRVREGAVLLISGPFAGDPHQHATDRAETLGLPYRRIPLEQREQVVSMAGSTVALTYSGMKTTVLSEAELADGKAWAEKSLGKGKILFSALPLELNDRLDSVAAVYAYALKVAKVEPIYTTALQDPGILICPTLLPHATLYALTSETNQTQVSFRDAHSGKTFRGELQPGRAALLLIDENGTLITNYGWQER